MSEPVLRLLIELEDVTPSIWRRVDVPAGATLAALHDVIQAVMRWDNAHLHEFHIGERVYGDPMPEAAAFGRRVYKATGVRLGQLMERGVEQFIYVYDFGDNWRHSIRIEGTRDGDPDTDYPVLVDGARRAPPDDVGGVPGLLEFLDAISDPEHPDHDHLLSWAGGGFDPDDIDRRGIELDLAILAEFRRRGLAGRRSRARNARH